MATLTTKIVLRHDTAANWEKYNPVLLEGEMGVETDTNLLKVGDGTSTWVALDYINKFEGSTSTATHYEGTAEEGETDNDVIERVLGETTAQQDDIFIVKRLIAAEHYSHTAYVYNGSNWAAMDGNYNADNVYFDEDLRATAPIGVITIGSSGSTTIAAKGKNLNEVFNSIISKLKYPTATAPSVSVAFTNTTKSVEVGTTIIPTYSASFSSGSYTYGPSTGIAPLTWTIEDNANEPNTLDTDAGSFPAIQLGDLGDSINAYSITATAEYNQGSMPRDNYGNDYEAARIAAGTVSATAATKLTCYRNFFYGTLSDTEPLNSETIRGLVAGGNYNSAKTVTVNAGAANAKRVVVAYPANTTRLGLKEVILTSSMNIPITELYEKQEDVEVYGAEGYAAIPYTVYVYEPRSLGEDEVHQIKLA